MAIPPLLTRTRTYRVEHHDDDDVRDLGALTDRPHHHTALDPFVSRLLREGIGGEVVVREEATGRVIIRRAVRSFGSRQAWKRPSGLPWPDAPTWSGARGYPPSQRADGQQRDPDGEPCETS